MIKMKFTTAFIVLDIFITVGGWSCVPPVEKVYSQINTNSVVRFSADLANLNSPRQFFVTFYNGKTLASVRYGVDKSYVTDVISGVSITADRAGNVDVTLENVQLNNAGIYSIVSPGFPRRCNCLYILGTPTKPSITLNKIPSVGESATLTCSSTSTTTPSNHSLSLTYNWRVNNVDNPSASRYSYTSNRNTLKLSNIVKDDANKLFICAATEVVSDGNTSSWSDSFALGVLYGPENMYFSPVDTSYERAENTGLNPVTCNASCNPTCSFKWTKIGQTVLVSNTAILNLGRLASSDAGIYRCTATRSGSSSQTKDVTVNVIYGPRYMMLTPNLTSHRVNEYSNLSPITCSVDCWDCSFRWTGPNSYSTFGPVLDIGSMNRTMAGSYICTATNTKLSTQTKQTRQVQIEVRHGPESVSFTPEKINYTVDEGSTISSIKCEAACFPTCIYKWTKDGRTAVKSNTGTLQLGQIQKSDAGSYTCRATNGDTASKWIEKNIIINVRYGPYQYSTHLSPTAEYYTRNEKTTLSDISCSADCYPGCTYNWTKTRQEGTTTASSTGIISVGTLDRYDAANYTCTAKNPGKFVSPTTTKQVTVKVRYGPDTAEVNVQSPYYLTEGDTNVHIECTSECYPGCFNAWTNLTSGSKIRESGVLSLPVVNKYIAGDYKCTCINTASDYTKSSETTITVTVNERTFVKSFYIGQRDGQTNVTVDEHDVGVYFTCVVGGNPASNAKITFEGEVLKQQTDTNELIFIRQNVDCLQSGLYTCEGNDSRGLISSKNATLLVKCSPRPRRQILRNITSPLYVPVTLTFKAIAYPEPGPKGFSWYKENRIGWIPLLSNKDLHVSSSGLQTSLTILNVSLAHFGQYRVTVANGIGTYDQYLFLTEEGVTVVDTESGKDNNERTTLMIVSITLGIICIVVTTYATGITILYKRNLKRNGKHHPYKPSTQTTCVNSVSLSGTTNVQESGRSREYIDNATGIEEDSLRQYTDLTQYSRDEKATYEVIQLS